MSARRVTTIAIMLAALVWAGTVAAAYRAIRRFETTPGDAANAPAQWPAASAIPRAAGEWSMVMLVHPKCSCSRASVSELQAVLDQAPKQVRTYVMVYRPREMPQGWEQTEVVKSASGMQRVNVIFDENGREADLFGGFTSGQTFVYDDRGRLRFAGGITSLRGHAGLNRGRADIIDIVSSRLGSGTHPVFGCAIATPDNEKRMTP
jgi:hypothetical protein